MKVLVTAATGFIGAYCVDELLRRGDQVLATGRDRNGLEYCRRKGIPSCRLDITRPEDFESLPEHDFGAVVHPAGLVPSNVKEEEYDPRNYFTSNTIGTLNVLEYCRRHGIGTVLYTQSHSDVEGHWDSGRPIPDDAPCSYSLTGDHAMYIVSKNAAVDCIKHYELTFGLRGIIFRLPPVYGYGPHTTIFKDGKRLVTGFEIFMEKARSGQDLEVWGDAQRGRDIVSVKDVADAIYLALHSPNAKGTYNICSGRKVTLEEEARAMIEVFGDKNRSKIVYRPEKKNSLRPFVYDISKAKKDFGWKPKRSFVDILKDYQEEERLSSFDFLVRKKE